MRRKTTALTALTALPLLGFAAAAAFATPIAAKKTALITIPGSIVVNAPPAKVWAAVTSLDGFGALTGFQATGGAKSFATIGDAVPAKVWTDAGRLVVTELVPEKELRVAWEPGNASYLCSKRVVLSPFPGGTRVEYTDRYTDDQPNADETARQVAQETEKHLAAFKALAEK
jgi:uncharacterized protein YndB with AHSA1/START domain